MAILPEPFRRRNLCLDAHHDRVSLPLARVAEAVRLPRRHARRRPAFIVYAGGAIEFFGGLLVMLGLFTRWAGFLCSGMMAVAYWWAHGTKAFFPLLNGGELAVLYCFVFLFISAHGPGPWSVDGLMRKSVPLLP